MEYTYTGDTEYKLKVLGRRFKLVKDTTYKFSELEVENITTTRPDLFEQFVSADKKKKKVKKEDK